MQRPEPPTMFPPVRQLSSYYSGPAIAEAVLRSWNLLPIRLGLHSDAGYQQFLAGDEYMKTDANRRTFPDDWVRVVNHIVMSLDLNAKRKYSRIKLAQSENSINDEFYQIVLRSLSHNVPVAIAFVGQTQESYDMMGARYNYLLVTSLTGMGEATSYTYLDPSDGSFRQFDTSQLTYLLAGGVNQNGEEVPSYVIAYLDSADKIFLNSLGATTQQQSSDECNFLTKLTSVCTTLSRTKRSAYRSSTCMAVDSTNPMFNYEDYIHVVYKLIGRNGIQIKLTRPTAMTLERVFMENDRQSFLQYLETLLTRIVQKGTVNDSDRSHAAQVIYDGMPYFHEKTLTLLRQDDNRSIFIQTYRAYSFHDTAKSIGTDNTIYIEDQPKA
ncbi:CLUMA_CG015796, isoform A [Clunio marinus]|uniref:CLUMA_CG015796, isoform A n=1 Tax=Clunio marinus TaxID=568069 RepID=A0A1J1IQV3_9DIPT|nr:CLUMA_CG015796, isoform A [Clunio marinus]